MNCQDLQLQITCKAPTVSIDKTDGMQLFLADSSLDVEIFTSKSGCVNVTLPKEPSSDDYVGIEYHRLLNLFVLHPLPFSYLDGIVDSRIF